MNKIKFFYIAIIFLFLFIILTYIYYQETKNSAIENAQVKIEEFLLNYKAFRSYVSKVQKEEVYRLQKDGKLDKDYFNPILLSSTFSARNVNLFYNIYRNELNERPIEIRFASDNPRNISNKASKKESEILKQFNENEIEKYVEIIEKDDGAELYYVLPTKRTTDECMRCHSDPKIAPVGLVQIYGDKNGFYEKKGNIRAILSTTYPLDNDLKSANEKFITMTVITFIIFIISLIVVYKFTKKIEEVNRELDNKVTERTKELENEKRYIEALLDTNPSIIMVTTGKELISCNQKLLEFFEFETLDKFKEKHKCICEYFDKLDDKKLSENYEIDGKNWCEYLVQDQQETHLLSLIKNDKVYYFNIGAIYLDKNSKNMLVSLQNITEIKKKDKMIMEQSKMASIADMLHNIAHQWRQPLSLISTASTGILLNKEYGILNDDFLEKNLQEINDTSQKLSKTIDNFNSYFHEDKATLVNINRIWQDAIEFVDSEYKNNTIKIIKECEDIEINGIRNDLLQIFITLLTNTKDAHKNSLTKEKLLFITMNKENNNIIIKVKDNAGGINKDILPNIFEPYSTTKHKSLGTGLGLYMVYQTVTNKLNGNMWARNIELNYQKINYKGAEFIIEIPLN